GRHTAWVACCGYGVAPCRQCPLHHRHPPHHHVKSPRAHFLPRPKSSWTSSSHERLEPAREDSRSLLIGACKILFTIADESPSIADRQSTRLNSSHVSTAYTSPTRISSSRSRSETIVGITSTSPWRARNFATSRSTSTS